MKTKEELNALKEEVETLNKKLHELTEDELKQITGGAYINEKNNVFGDNYLYGYTYDYFNKYNPE